METSRSAHGSDSLKSERRENKVVIQGNTLTIDEIVRVARLNAKVNLTGDKAVLDRVQASHDYIVNAVVACTPVRGVVPKICRPIYGVTTGFGGMAHNPISAEDASELQQNLIWFMKTGAGKPLPRAHVRAAMLVRANNHMLGFSGLRLELIQRIATFLNAN